MNFSPPGRAVLFPRPRGDRRRRGVPSRFVPAAVLGGARLSVCGPSERACVCVFRCWACRSAGTCLRRSRGAAASARLPSASCSRASASSRCSPSPSSRSSRCSTSCTAWQSCSSLRRLCGYVCRAPASSARSSAPRPQGLPLPLPRFRCKGHSRNKSCFVPVFRGVHALTIHDPTHRRCRAQLPCWSRRAGLSIKPFRIFCTVSVLATGHRQPGAAGCGWPQSCKGTGRSWLQGPVAPCPLSTMPLQLLLVHSACVACDAVAGTHRDVSTCGRASGRALLDRIAAACGMRLRLVAAASTYLRTRLVVVTLLQAWTCACLTPHLGQDHEKIGFGRLRPRSQQISCVLVATFHCLWPQC